MNVNTIKLLKTVVNNCINLTMTIPETTSVPCFTPYLMKSSSYRFYRVYRVRKCILTRFVSYGKYTEYVFGQSTSRKHYTVIMIIVMIIIII